MQDIFGLDQRKSAARWQATAFQLGIVMSAAGLLVMLLTALKSFGAAELLGQVLGLLLLGSGLMATVGSSRRNTHLMIGSLTVSLMGMLLAFEFITEVNREAKLDCALAELYTKSLATERMLEDRKHADVLTKLYVRINEVEDHLSGVQSGAIKSMQLSQAQESLKSNDHAYIQVKMRNLKEHADTLLDSILNHPNLTESQIYQMDNTQKEELRARVKAADDVSKQCLQVIDTVINKYEQGFDGAEVFEDYQKGLQALMVAYTASSPGEHFQLTEKDGSKLTQAANEIQHMKSALDRATEDGYHKLDPLGHGQELKALQDSRAKRREIASNEFLSLLHRHEMTKHGSFLQDLPEHCIIENNNERMMLSLGLTGMLLELSAMYCTLSYVLCMPRKRD